MIVAMVRKCQSVPIGRCQILSYVRWTACGLLWLLAPLSHAALLDSPLAIPRGTANITLRERLHVNTLITEPGTIEIEWDNLYSYTSGNFNMPSVIKYTPTGKSILWGRTEFSAAFDSIDSVAQEGRRTTQFSDRLSFAANAVLKDGEKLDIAIQPAATFFLRGQSGARLGATAIVRYDVGRNSMGATMSWTAATAPSPANPAGTWDFGGGFGRRLAASGAWGHLTPHFNVVYERSTGFGGNWASFAGVEYQITQRIAVDFSGQRLGLAGGNPDRQLLVGLTMNFGKVQ
jgi:hypothetical protein